MFLNKLYTVINKSDLEVTILLSDANHPIFKAHFPSQPILPGFIHLEIISKLFDIAIIGVKKAKFNEIVLPNDILKYIKNDTKIKVTCNDKIVANFNLGIKC